MELDIVPLDHLTTWITYTEEKAAIPISPVSQPTYPHTYRHSVFLHLIHLMSPGLSWH